MNKTELLESMLRECDIVTHLLGKVQPGGWDFRLTPAQRSTTELCRYLAFAGQGIAQSMAEGKWDAYEALEKECAALGSADFPAAMDRQKDGLRALLAPLSDADLATKTSAMPWGETMSLGKAIVILAYGSLVAYRMQLFLHAKAAGNASIGTSNCWAGRDTPAQPA